jgi:TP901 family phage tail tape measure protein
VASGMEALIKIRADASQAQRTLAGASGQLQNMQRGAASFDRSSGILGGLGSTVLTGGVLAGVTGMLGKSVQASMDFNDAFADVVRTVDDADKVGGFGALKKSIIDLSTRVPVTANELAGIAAIGGQMDVGADQLMPFVETVATLGKTTKINTEIAAEGLGMLANVTHNRNWAQMASTILRVGKINVAGEQGVINIAERLAPVGTMIGMNLPQITALGAAVLDTGVEAEMGGTAVSQAFLQMQDAVSSSSIGMIGNIKEVRDAIQRVGDIGDDLGLAQMQQGEMYTKKGKLKKQFRQHPSEVRAMELRISRLQREQTDAQTDLDEKRNPGQAALNAWADVAGMSTDDFSKNFKAHAYDTFRGVLYGLHDRKAGGEDIFALLDKMGIKGIRETQTIAALAGTPEHLDALYGARSEGFDNMASGALTPDGFVSALSQAKNKFDPTKNPLAGQQIAGNILTAAGIAIGDKIAPGMVAAELASAKWIKDIVDNGGTVEDILKKIAGPIAEIAQPWDGMIENLKKFNEGLGTTVDMLGPIGLGMLLLKANPFQVASIASKLGPAALSRLGLPGLIAGATIGVAEVAHDQNWFGTNADKQTGEAPNDVALWLSDRVTQLAGGQSGQVQIDLLNAAQALRGGAPKEGTHVEATINVYPGPNGVDFGQLKDQFVTMFTQAADQASAPQKAPVTATLGGARYKGGGN